MNLNTIENAFLNAKPKRFIKAAGHIAKSFYDWQSVDPTQDHQKAYRDLTDILATSMDTGARLVKTRYIWIGVALGIIATSIIVSTTNIKNPDSIIYDCANDESVED